MIKLESYYIKNFKGFEDSGVVASDKLNVFTGVNSGGKTTLIHALLFLKQLVESQDSKVKFNGQFVRMGNFKEVVFSHDLNKEIQIGLLLKYSLTEPSKKNLFYENVMKELANVGIKTPENEDSFNIRLEFGISQIKNDILVSKYKVAIFRKNEFKSTLELSYNKNTRAYDIVETPEGFPFNFEFESIMKDIFSKEDDKIKNKIKRFVDKMVNVDDLEIRFDGPLIPKECYSEKLERGSTLNKIYTDYIKNILKELCAQVYYIGPVRMQPKRLYTYEKGYDDNHMNPKGDNATYIYNKIGEEKFEFVLPPESEGTEYQLNNKGASFRKLISLWTKYIMGLNSSYMTSEKGISSYELRVNKHLITNVGFGASQLFPILVEGIRKKNGIIIFEQPEIHLHPNAQTRLVDFFIAIARHNNLKVIVETHSVHIIKRLVRRMVEDSELHDQTSVIFINTEKYLKSKITKLRYNELGMIDEWPEDFLDRTGHRETERIYRAQKNKMKKERK